MPAPFLVSAPLPPMAWVMLRVVEGAGLKAPPLLPSVTVRLALRPKLVVVCSVPPFSVSAPVVAPRPESAAMQSVPALTSVPPA